MVNKLALLINDIYSIGALYDSKIYYSFCLLSSHNHSLVCILLPISSPNL